MNTPSSVPAVSVGKTAYPLKSNAAEKGPVNAFPHSVTKDDFCLLDGPPYANGAPHLGHVLNKHLKDAVARAASALGHPVQWRPGWDCHGLPLELAVEKQGHSRKDPVAFVAAAKEFALSQVEVQKTLFMEQGWMADWEDPWMTCQPDKEAATLRVLSNLLEKNLLDVRFTSVPWCAQCGSTVANAEQEEKSWSRESWLASFEVLESSRSCGFEGQAHSNSNESSPSCGFGAVQSGDFLLSWTTTPWTLPLHRGLVLNPDSVLACLHKDDSRAWVSESSAELWAQRLGATVGEERVHAQDLLGLKYKTSWGSFEVTLDEKVLDAAGTGFLHAVPGLSELDTKMGRDHQWALVQYLTPYGRLQNSPLDSQNGTGAGSKESMQEVELAYTNNPWFLKFAYASDHPHCWRHKTPLLTRASRQVFLTLTDEVRARAHKMVEGMQFTPDTGRNRLLAFMSNRPDWCLSRQRTWGVPMALYLDATTGQPHENAVAWMREVADVVEQKGVQAWWSGEAQPKALPEDVEVVPDVLDVWFDSACVPQFVSAADCVVEGSDQHRGWFQSCVWLAAAWDAPAPFKRVVTHGFVVDGVGEKLSKSKGGDKAAAKDNSKSMVAPWSQFPTDVVRVWALSGSEGADKVWSQDAVSLAQAWVSRWRGVLRFMVANTLTDNHEQTHWNDMLPWDQYWVDRCKSVMDAVLKSSVEGYTGQALHELSKFGEEFSSVCLGSWKDRLYCAPEHTDERKSLDCALKACLLSWLKVLEVATPRLREEVVPFLGESLKSFNGDLPLTWEAQHQEQVEVVLEWRKQFSTQAEASMKGKVSPMQRLALVPLSWNWSLQSLADALDVGEVKVSDGLELLVSSHQLCQRCRRAHSAWNADAVVCMTCEKRTQND